MGVVGARGTVKERLMERFKHEGDCWIWTAATNHTYGKLYAWGKLRSAHRVAYKLFKGPIPSELEVRHTCDRPRCVNPDHLILGTRKQNMQDAVRRGRMARGENCGPSKMTREQVLALRREYPRTEVRIAELCDEWGVTRRTIYRARDSETWTHLPSAGEIARSSTASSTGNEGAS